MESHATDFIGLIFIELYFNVIKDYRDVETLSTFYPSAIRIIDQCSRASVIEYCKIRGKRKTCRGNG